MELSDFDIVYDDTVTESSSNGTLEKKNDKSTQIEQNNIYLILHDNKCYGFADARENALNIIKRITKKQVSLLKIQYPESNIYYEFDTRNNIYTIYSVHKLLLVSYDSLESVIKFIKIKHIK
jgi:hypothetical protein